MTRTGPSSDPDSLLLTGGPVVNHHGSVGSDLRVVHVLDTEGFAGRESVVHRLASAQMAEGIDVRVAAVVEEGSGSIPFLDVAGKAGVPVDEIRLPARAYLEERRRLTWLLRTREADVMHSHGYRPDVVGGIAARRAGAATVSTVHGFTGGGLKNRFYEWLQRRSLRRFERVVGVSEQVADGLVDGGLSPEQVTVVRNAWAGGEEFLSRTDARDELGLEGGRFVIGWVGRLSREKGLDVLLEALRRSEPGDVRLSVVGDGPERGALERDARRTSEEITVHWHGPIRRASRLFKAFDVLVLSSRTEGTPMVLLEAMAAGVPVVSTAVGGIPDVITPEEGWLVPPEDPEALARAIEAVRGNTERAESRAAAARERVQEEFGSHRWVESYAGVYREAVEVRRSHGGRR